MAYPEHLLHNFHVTVARSEEVIAAGMDHIALFSYDVDASHTAETSVVVRNPVHICHEGGYLGSSGLLYLRGDRSLHDSGCR